ncbi:NACHT-N domain-containing protein [Fusarium sp. LHS14.1]|nr:NACHT-N domain-containing protein [Fusarium sp. LHS14.1]
MKTSTQTSPSHLGSAGKVKRIVGKIRRHAHPPSVTSKSSVSSSSTRASNASSNCPLRHHRNSQSRRGSAAEEERARDVELWNAAYDALKKDARSNGLVLAYENIIGHELPEAHRPGHHGNPNELPMDGERRLELMSMIASSGLNREVSVTSKSDSGDDDAREILVEARSTVASLMPQQPSAALAFAGICSLTPLLLDPLLRHGDLRSGFVHLITTIPHYMSLARCTYPSSWASSEDYERLQLQVRQTLLDLYRRILEYEMNIVCAAASAWNMAARNVVDWQGWRTMDDAVREKDVEVMGEMEKYGTDEARAMIEEKSVPEGGGRRSISSSTDAEDRH